MEQDEDIALVMAAQKGDAKAFETLVNRSYETIFRFSFRWCGRREDAEDIAQEVCIKLARVLKSFKGDSGFSTWLYRVTINTAKDWQRAQGRHNKAGEVPEETASSQKTDEGAKVADVLRAVNALPEGEKEALLLVVFEDMNYREAAKVLGCAENTVAWRIHEARKKLDHLMKEERRYG